MGEQTILLLIAGLATFGSVWTCDQQAAENCIANNDLSAFSSMQFSESDPPTKDQLKQYCDVLQSLVSCLDTHLSGCSSDQNAQFSQYKTYISERCNDVLKCVSASKDCRRSHPNVETRFPSGVRPEGSPDDPTSEECNALIPYGKCLKEKLMPQCPLVPAVEQWEFKQLEFECHRATCSAIQTCDTTFRSAQPAESGLDAQKCELFKTYVSCVKDAIPSCSGLKLPRGQPDAGSIADLVSQTCDLLGTKSSIYTCASFTTCIDTAFDAINPLSPGYFCETLQRVLGCAVDHAATCGITGSDVFVSEANQLMLDFADKGCGSARFLLASCQDLVTCQRTFASQTSEVGFGPVCSAAVTFMQCADAAMTTCSLNPPERSPRLSKLSELAQRMCTDFSGQDITTCRQFETCLGVNIPAERARASSVEWCRSATKTLQCAKTYGPQCNLPDDVKDKFVALYKDIVDAGCPDTYEQAAGTAAGHGPSLFLALLVSMAAYRAM